MQPTSSVQLTSVFAQKVVCPELFPLKVFYVKGSVLRAFLSNNLWQFQHDTDLIDKNNQLLLEWDMQSWILPRKLASQFFRMKGWAILA